MALNVVEIPFLNSERFIPLDTLTTEKYHTKHFDYWWMQEYLLEFQKYNKFQNNNDTQYYQLKQFSDTVGIQFAVDRDNTNEYKLTLMACNGDEFLINNETYSKVFVRDGDTYDANGAISGIQLNRIQYNFKIEDILGDALNEGKYYLLFEVSFTDESVKRFISEPYMIKAEHPKTVLIEYSNSENNYDIFFDVNPRFSLRLDGYLLYNTNKIERTTFRNQEAALRGLYARDWRLYTFTIGGRTLLSDYHIEKIVKINKCDFTYIDGKRFIMEEGDNIEVQNYGGNYPLKSIKYSVADYYPADSAKYANSGSFYIMDMGASFGFPYCVSFLKFFKLEGTGALFPNFMEDYPNQVREVITSTEETAFIAELNDKALALGMSGNFSVTDDKLYYNSGAAEDYALYYKDQRLGFTVRFSPSAGLGSAIGFDWIEYVGGSHIYSVNKFVGGTRHNVVAPTLEPGTSSGMSIYTETTIISGLTDFANTHSLYIYTDNKMASLYVYTSDSNIRAFSGHLSSILGEFRAYGGSIGTFDVNAILYDCRKTITYLNIQYLGITDVYFDTVDRTDPYDWYNLKYIYTDHNELDNGHQDMFYIGYYTYVQSPYPLWLSGGTLSTRFQAPTSNPTSTSAGQRSAMISHGYTILF